MSLCAEELSFSYGTQRVLDSVSFEAEYGEFVSVLGANGAGKSTLFRCMLGLLKPARGCTRIDGRNVAALSAGELARLAAYIPQSHDPVFNYSVIDIVLMGTAAQFTRFAAPGKAQRALAEEMLERLHIADLRDRGYRGISGGERQLVLIARAMAQQAKILIMDEPSSSLDFANRDRLMRVTRELAESGYCVLQSTHDPDQAYRYSDRVLALQDGKVLAYGAPQDVIRPEIVSELYGMDIEVCSLRGDTARVCLPAEEIN